MSDDIKENGNKPAKAAKKITLGDKECTILQYAALTGLGKRLDVWVRKTYDTKEILSANAWAKKLVEAGAINESPEILNQTVTVSK